MGVVSAREAFLVLALFTVATQAFALTDPRLEVDTATLPRFDSVDGALHSSRMDVTLLPHRRSGVGFAFGVSSVSGTNSAVAPWASGMPTMDFGVHWRVTLDSNYRFDVTAYRRVQNADAISLIESHDPEYGARVELGLGSIQGRSKGFVSNRGFVGFQLESGARVTIRRKSGGPMLYYRNAF
jgi:hypothetical protein